MNTLLLACGLATVLLAGLFATKRKARHAHLKYVRRRQIIGEAAAAAVEALEEDFFAYPPCKNRSPSLLPPM